MASEKPSRSVVLNDSLFGEDVALSPIVKTVVPRILSFEDSDEETQQEPMSPPCRRVAALRLFDTPNSKKMLTCSTPECNPQQKLLQADESPKLMPCTPSITSESTSIDIDNVSTIINPFMPHGHRMGKRRSSSLKTIEGNSVLLPPKRLKEISLQRFEHEFLDLGLIGIGQFGRVTKCIHRLDGCVYAIKQSLKPIIGSALERTAMTEVYAHAILGDHPNVVRYYSSWAENGHMIIQNEYCDGGSLQQRFQKQPLTQPDLLVLLEHVARGLKYIHSMNLAHMDLKPANILISRKTNGNVYFDADEFIHEDEQNTDFEYLYKIADLGHVTLLATPTVEEGDCRYLPNEVLQEVFTDLSKADIFAFGLTLFEAAGGGPLPMNGELWHHYRNGGLPHLENLSEEFNKLIKIMVDPEPANRPSAASILNNSLLQQQSNKSKLQLSRELAAAKQRNEILEKNLQVAASCIKALKPGNSETIRQFRNCLPKRSRRNTK